uniref:EamA domain-containing protein n=1 Tax=Chromera velia CCMP2878 TaxID=1169474 RepID=A0A0G4HRH2_9ALVE|eukprot:Cvel_1285.t1-p1 / transcript=Cvel_1285.t1 / gene=Cvel_1285 / organism=Chromera_velia_CCMP2878 / gene_product=Solute carrier family 35 member G1, putative / transcript_product=Solute carrier family 35 member G1, putative / location=Cvel_scaffold43:70861-73952(+) / protein_length=645 / sequence_SO=supercontig / SO=protein_coding / is_pseudo=false
MQRNISEQSHHTRASLPQSEEVIQACWQDSRLEEAGSRGLLREEGTQGSPQSDTGGGREVRRPESEVMKKDTLARASVVSRAGGGEKEREREDALHGRASARALGRPPLPLPLPPLERPFPPPPPREESGSPWEGGGEGGLMASPVSCAECRTLVPSSGRVIGKVREGQMQTKEEGRERGEKGQTETGEDEDEGRTSPQARSGRSPASSSYRCLRSLAGLVCASAGALAIALLALMVELTVPHVGSVLVVIVVRAIVASLLSLICFYGGRLLELMRSGSEGKRDTGKGSEDEAETGGGIFGPKKYRKLLWIRGTLSGFAMNGFFFMLTQLPMGDSSAIFFTSPLLTAAFARLWLGETWHWLNWVSGVTSVIGVLIIARPNFLKAVLDPIGLPPSPTDESDHLIVPRWVAVLVGVMGALSSAIGLTILRKIRNVSFASNVFALSVMSGLMALGLLLGLDFFRPSVRDLAKVPPLAGWGGCVLVGVVGFCSQTLVTFGLKLEKAGPAVFALCLDVLFAFILQALVLKTAVGPGSLVGGGLIVLAVVLLFAAKMRTVRGGGEGESDGVMKGEEVETFQEKRLQGKPGTAGVGNSKEGIEEEDEDLEGGEETEKEFEKEARRERRRNSTASTTAELLFLSEVEPVKETQ